MSKNLDYYNMNDENFADITVNDLTFNARVAGLSNNGDPVILLHGFPETSRMWKDLITLLDENNYRVVAPDQRGYSAEARPKGVESYKINLQ